MRAIVASAGSATTEAAEAAEAQRGAERAPAEDVAPRRCRRLAAVPEPRDHPAIQRVVEAAARKGVTLDIRVFDEPTHTAEEAAAAVGAELGQIVKSLVFVAPGDDGSIEPVIVLVSGPNRVDLARLAVVSGNRDVRRST